MAATILMKRQKLDGFFYFVVAGGIKRGRALKHCFGTICFYHTLHNDNAIVII